MILTVTPNIALDRTYVVDHVELGAVHKVTRAFAQTGGKGVNVARALAQLGARTLVTGLVGAAGLDEATNELFAAGLAPALHPVTGPPRQTVTVTARDGTTTAFDEPGPTITEPEWAAFADEVGGLLAEASMLVVAGSLPPGAPEQALQQLVACANDRDVPAIVDSRGAAMRAALNANPLVAKLNREELAQTVGRDCQSDEDVLAAARELQDAGAQRVIVTLGADGAIALDGHVAWRVTHPTKSGNPIGAGDAFTAGVVVKLATGESFPEALREGAAAALASLRSPTAGDLRPSAVRALESEIGVDLLRTAAGRSGTRTTATAGPRTQQ